MEQPLTLLFKLENKDLVLELVAEKCSFLWGAVAFEGVGVVQSLEALRKRRLWNVGVSVTDQVPRLQPLCALPPVFPWGRPGTPNNWGYFFRVSAFCGVKADLSGTR